MAIKMESMTIVKELPTFSNLCSDSIQDYDEFAKDWRIHFVETMNPQFMPDEWKIDRKTRPTEVWIPPRFSKY